MWEGPEFKVSLGLRVRDCLPEEGEGREGREGGERRGGKREGWRGGEERRGKRRITRRSKKKFSD